MLQVTLPIYWTKTFKTKPSTTHLVGLNWFRNAQYHDQNNLKKDFTELVLNQLTPFETPFNKFHVTYELYYKSPVCDPSNIIALIEKVSLDAFKHANVIIDDNVNFHHSSSWSVISQDKLNPRCVITIQEVI